MAKHPFLSDDWFDSVVALVSANPPPTEGTTDNLLINFVVTETPFGDREFHTIARDGKGGFGRGHEDSADVTLTTDYTTAREVFTSGNPQAGMQAFMAGKVKVQGDMTKLMAAQASGGPTGPTELQQQIRDLTE